MCIMEIKWNFEDTLMNNGSLSEHLHKTDSRKKEG